MKNSISVGTLLILTFSLTLSSCKPSGDHAGMEHPLILFLISDDMNDWIGCLGGHPDALTPNIDRLAARSVLLTAKDDTCSIR